MDRKLPGTLDSHFDGYLDQIPGLIIALSIMDFAFLTLLHGLKWSNKLFLLILAQELDWIIGL